MGDAKAETEARRVGVREVARAAGVSSQTVSRVINDRPNIRPETRARVEAAMAQLDYRVNNAARSLGTSTTRTLGVIASDATLYGPSVGIAALEAAARAAGRWIATAYADAADRSSVADAAERLLAHGVDGIIVLAPHAGTWDALTSSRLGVPVGALHGGPGVALQEEAAALAVQHLVALGHRRIARLAGPADWLEAAARDRGAAAALTAAGLEPGLRAEGDWTALDAATRAVAIARAIRAPGGPTAIVVANDQMALGLIAGLRAEGIEVPQDVSVTGFDDNPDAAFYRPSLTTVSVDLFAEARRCVAEVLGADAPDQPAAPAPAAIARARLIVRASSAPPPATAG